MSQVFPITLLWFVIDYLEYPRNCQLLFKNLAPDSHGAPFGVQRHNSHLHVTPVSEQIFMQLANWMFYLPISVQEQSDSSLVFSRLLCVVLPPSEAACAAAVVVVCD